MEKAQRKYRNFLGDNLKIILAITCVVLAFLLFRQCSETKQANREAQSVQNFLNDTIEYYKDETGALVAQKSVLRGDEQTLEILLSKKIDSLGQLKRLVEKFKGVESAGNIVQVVRIDTVKIPYEVEVPFEFSRNWSKHDKSYFVKGTSTNTGITIDSLSIPNTLSFAIGGKSTGFWKSEYRIEAVNSNPFIKTTGLDAYSFSQRKKRFGLSIYAGVGISENFTFAPQIGVGFSFDLIRF